MISLHHFADQILHPRGEPLLGSLVKRTRDLRPARMHLPSAQALFRAVVIGSLVAAAILIWFLQSSAAYVDYPQAPTSWVALGGDEQPDPFDAAKQAATIEELPPQF